ncbi:hypothetical protein THAOC_29767, partial [Thalassiosira oceanica]
MKSSTDDDFCSAGPGSPSTKRLRIVKRHVGSATAPREELHEGSYELILPDSARHRGTNTVKDLAGGVRSQWILPGEPLPQAWQDFFGDGNEI